MARTTRGRRHGRGRSLLRRIRRDHTAAHEASLAQLTRALDDPEALARLLGGALRETLAGMVRARPGIFADVVGRRGSKLPITALVADLSTRRTLGSRRRSRA